MSSDLRLDAIVGMLEDLGYNPLVKTLPTIRTADVPNLPVVEISPIERPDGYWITSGNYSIKQEYELCYIDDNKLDNSVPDPVYTFKNLMISTFKGTPAPLMAIQGTWFVRTKDLKDYRRDLAIKHYNYSALRIEVNYILT